MKNPLDINPGADDEVHARVVRMLAEDAGVDAVVVGLDPLSPAMRTLAESGGHRYGFENPGSIAKALPKVAAAVEKPIVGVVDGGRLYDPLVDVLIKEGLAVFRSSDRAVHALALYMEARLHGASLRRIKTKS